MGSSMPPVEMVDDDEGAGVRCVDIRCDRAHRIAELDLGNAGDPIPATG
jgi:hypothetical protein